MLLLAAMLLPASMLLLLLPSLRARLRLVRWMPMPPGPRARPGPRNPPPPTILPLALLLFPRSLVILALSVDAKDIVL